MTVCESNPLIREGWSEASEAIAAVNDDELVWPEFGNDNESLEW